MLPRRPTIGAALLGAIAGRRRADEAQRRRVPRRRHGAGAGARAPGRPAASARDRRGDRGRRGSAVRADAPRPDRPGHRALRVDRRPGILALGVPGLLAPQPAPAGEQLRRFATAFVLAGVATGAVIVLVIFALGRSRRRAVAGRRHRALATARHLLDRPCRRPRTICAGPSSGWRGGDRLGPPAAPSRAAAGARRRGARPHRRRGARWMALAQLGPFDLHSSRLTFPLAVRVARRRAAAIAPPPARSSWCRGSCWSPARRSQTLQAYPVAGAQVQFGGVLLAVTTGIVIADGVREVRDAVAAQASLPGRSPPPRRLAVVIGSPSRSSCGLGRDQRHTPGAGRCRSTARIACTFPCPSPGRSTPSCRTCGPVRHRHRVPRVRQPAPLERGPGAQRADAGRLDAAARRRAAAAGRGRRAARGTGLRRAQRGAAGVVGRFQDDPAATAACGTWTPSGR